MKVSKILFLPLTLSVIVFLHEEAGLGAIVRRCLVVLTLGTILWIIYNLLKEQIFPIRMIIFATLVAVASFLLIIATLSKTGW